MTQGMMIDHRRIGAACLPFCWIILACGLAHLWCLESQFYMDDIVQIRDNEVIRTGEFLRTGLLSWTNFGYFVIYQCFGMSSVAYHAFNWLLHTAVACTLFAFGRDFIRGKFSASVALFAALLFAVHPLGSEIPNYARTQDIAWVTLFSLLAAWALLRFLQGGAWWKLVLCGAAVIGAMLSKGPGLFHALMAVGAVGLVNLGAEQWKFLRRWGLWMVGTGALTLGIFWLMGMLDFWVDPIKEWSKPRFIGHAYTLSRVFWEFSWRAVIPVALSSDHEITETLIPLGSRFWNIPDKGAMLAMVSFLALTGTSVFLAWRHSTRHFGVCLFLFAATILFRFLYLIPEFMPEYRIYPGLPWFCLGAAILLTVLWKSLFEIAAPLVPVLVLLGGFAFLSAKRSFVWHDTSTLTADVLQRYPARARAVWEMNTRDAEKGNWQAIIDRQREVWPEVERQFVTRNQKLSPIREIPSGDFVFAMVGIFGNYARAIAHTVNPAAGLHVTAQLEAHLRRMKMDPKSRPLEFGHLYHDRALIFEMAGDYRNAAKLMNMKCVPQYWPDDRRRIESKLGAKPDL